MEKEEYFESFILGQKIPRTLGRSYYQVQFPTCDILMGESRTGLELYAISLPNAALVNERHWGEFVGVSHQVPLIAIPHRIMSHAAIRSNEFDVTTTQQIEADDIGITFQFLNDKYVAFRLARDVKSKPAPPLPLNELLERPTHGDLFVGSFETDSKHSVLNYLFGKSPERSIVYYDHRLILVRQDMFQPPELSSKTLEMLNNPPCLMKPGNDISLLMEKINLSRSPYASIERQGTPELKQYLEYVNAHHDLMDKLNNIYGYRSYELKPGPKSESYKDPNTGEQYVRGGWASGSFTLDRDYAHSWCKVITKTSIWEKTLPHEKTSDSTSLIF